jgi:hypothetical protein
LSFYPSTGNLSSGLQTEHIVLRPLRAADNSLDYAAVMDSQDYLRFGTAGEWPRPDFTPSENLLDLQRHEADHDTRRNFTFTVLNHAQTLCLGCVYINPLEPLLHQYKPLSAKPYAFPPGCAYVQFWMRPGCQAEKLDKHLLGRLIVWFDKEWDFPRVFFIANRLETHLQHLYEQEGLDQLFALDTPNFLTLYG